jgi:hypothetical protein
VEGIEVAVKDGTGVANDFRHFVVKFTDFRQRTYYDCSSTPTSGSSGKKFGIGFDVVVVTGGGGKVKAVEGLFFLVRLAEQVAHFGGSYKSTHRVELFYGESSVFKLVNFFGLARLQISRSICPPYFA